MTDHVMARRHDEAIQSRAQLLKPVQSKSLPALLDRHSLRPRDDGTCHGEEGRRSHPVQCAIVETRAVQKPAGFTGSPRPAASR